jgi:DNA-directed RNA polymerase subunit F
VLEAKLTRKANLYYKYKLMRQHLERWSKFMREKDAIKTREEIRKRLETKAATEILGYLPSSMREIC